MSEGSYFNFDIGLLVISIFLVVVILVRVFNRNLDPKKKYEQY